MPSASLITQTLVHPEVVYCAALAIPVLLGVVLRRFLNDPAHVRTVIIRYHTEVDRAKLEQLRAAQELRDFIATNDRMAKT